MLGKILERHKLINDLGSKISNLDPSSIDKSAERTEVSCFPVELRATLELPIGTVSLHQYGGSHNPNLSMSWGTIERADQPTIKLTNREARKLFSAVKKALRKTPPNAETLLSNI